MTFTQVQGDYLFFVSTVTAATAFWTDVTYPTPSANGDSEVVLYFNQGTPGNITNYVDKYPNGDGVITGNYLTQRPFNANSSGTYYISAYLKVDGIGSTTDYTMKIGLNQIPCAGASMISVSMLAFLLPLLCFFMN